jgi:DNA-binding transcriptional LysR family regulator
MMKDKVGSDVQPGRIASPHVTRSEARDSPERPRHPPRSGKRRARRTPGPLPTLYAVPHEPTVATSRGAVVAGRTLRPPDIGELRAFCAAVDLGSLGRAARLLQVSQPALSKRLRALEALAGAQLLERSTRGVRPTAAGTRLYGVARKLLAEAEVVEGLLGGLHREDAPIRLAASHTVAEFLLATPLVEFQHRHQRHLSVELTVVNSSAARALVRDGRVELAIAAKEADGEPTDLTEIPFAESEIVIAVPEAHPWAKLEEVPMQELVATPMIMRDPNANSRRTVDLVLEREGLSLAAPLAEIGSTAAAKAAAISEQAPLLVSRLALSPGDGLVMRRAQGPRFERLFVILHSGEENLRSAARDLLAVLLAFRPRQLQRN